MSRPSGDSFTWLEYFSVASLYFGGQSYFLYSMTGTLIPLRTKYCWVAVSDSLYLSRLSLVTVVPAGGISARAASGRPTIRAATKDVTAFFIDTSSVAGWRFTPATNPLSQKCNARTVADADVCRLTV